MYHLMCSEIFGLIEHQNLVEGALLKCVSITEYRKDP